MPLRDPFADPPTRAESAPFALFEQT
jgi:hypothetical protein